MGARPRLLLALLLVAAGVAGPALVAAASPSPHRIVAVALAPRPGDLALAEVRFPHAGRLAPSARSLRLSAPAAVGADYLAAAAVSSPSGGGRVGLALVVNRPTGLFDPATVRLRVRAPASFGAALVRKATDPLTRPPATPPALCRLARGGAPPAMRVLFVHGAPVAGRSAAAAIGEALRAVCGTGASTEFEAAVRGASESGCGTSAPCEPTPAPPVPSPPGCTPCNPRPGQACPLSARAAVCVAAERNGAAPHPRTTVPGGA